MAKFSLKEYTANFTRVFIIFFKHFFNFLGMYLILNYFRIQKLRQI